MQYAACAYFIYVALIAQRVGTGTPYGMKRHYDNWVRVADAAEALGIHPAILWNRGRAASLRFQRGPGGQYLDRMQFDHLREVQREIADHHAAIRLRCSAVDAATSQHHVPGFLPRSVSVSDVTDTQAMSRELDAQFDAICARAELTVDLCRALALGVV